MSTIHRDQYNVETPLRCPICDQQLENTMIRTLGTVAPHTAWQMHIGHCPDHGWFQAEIVGRPPRDIFAVTKPFGTSRRLIVDDQEVYQFPTVWCDEELNVRMNKEHPVDTYNPKYWKPRGLV